MDRNNVVISGAEAERLRELVKRRIALVDGPLFDGYGDAAIKLDLQIAAVIWGNAAVLGLG